MLKINSVDENSQSHMNGIKSGHYIYEVNGEEIKSEFHFLSILEKERSSKELIPAVIFMGNVPKIIYFDTSSSIGITFSFDESMSSSSDTNTKQADVNKAISAINVGNGLNILNSILHSIAFLFLLFFSKQMGAAGIVMLIITGAGLLLSWAITYSLLSIVVTNGLTAKYAIIQPCKK